MLRNIFRTSARSQFHPPQNVLTGVVFAFQNVMYLPRISLSMEGPCRMPDCLKWRGCDISVLCCSIVYDLHDLSTVLYCGM